MMKNKKSAIILSIILAVQFIVPLSVLGIETYKNNELEKKGQEVKLVVDNVFFDDRGVVFRINELEELIQKRDDNFIVFENSENGFTKPEAISEFYKTDLYISENRLYSWYSEDWGFKYQSEIIKSENDYGYIDLYVRETEQANIKHGFCEGPETQAYAVFKIYKNRFKVVNVYIDGMPVDTVIKKYMNDEWDASRYEYHYTDKEDYYNEELIEDIYEAVMDEEITESVTA